MRTLRMSLAGTVILALLGGLGSVALAQEDADSAKVTPFTGVRLSVISDTSEEEWSVDGDIGHARFFKALETVEWSDPRLPSEMRSVANFDMYNIGEMREMPMAGTTLLVGQDGYWTGAYTGFCDEVGDCYGMNVLTGHGDYEGLFATLRATSEYDPNYESDVLFNGLIFEGEMPPVPDPIEPLTE